jgi:hypothetical protein
MRTRANKGELADGAQGVAQFDPNPRRAHLSDTLRGLALKLRRQTACLEQHRGFLVVVASVRIARA